VNHFNQAAMRVATLTYGLSICHIHGLRSFSLSHLGLEPRITVYDYVDPFRAGRMMLKFFFSRSWSWLTKTTAERQP
jgi:hypothetical protein